MKLIVELLMTALGIYGATASEDPAARFVWALSITLWFGAACLTFSGKLKKGQRE